MKQLTGKTAIVTGAASGIGLAIARAFVAAGMQVAIADIECDRAAEAAESLGAQTLPVAVDVRDAESVEAAAHATVERFGGIDVAVNNARNLKNSVSWELPLDDWHAVLDVNLWGVIHGIRSFVPRILASGGEGHIVNIASVAASAVIAGIRNNRPYVFTDDYLTNEVEQQLQALTAARGYVST